MILKKLSLLTLFFIFLLLFFNNTGVVCAVYRQDAASHSAKIQEQKEKIEAKRKEIKDKVEAKREKIKANIKRFARLYRFTIQSMGASSLVIAKEGASYTVNISDQTHLKRRFGGQSSLSEFNVGDVVSVFGKYNADDSLLVEARLIKNLSIQKRWGAFFGTVESLGTNQLVINSPKRGNQTVYITSSTSIINRDSSLSSLDQIQVGHKIRVKGVWDKNNNTLRETEEIKNFSLPEK